MKIIILYIVVTILSFSTIAMFLARLDQAIEIDSLKEHIKLQRKEMEFLQNITNDILVPCKLKITSFEYIVHKNGRNVFWQGNEALIGPFKISKNGSCLESITVIGL
jgi:cell division protein FtsL